MKSKSEIKQHLSHYNIGYFRQLWHLQEVSALCKLLNDDEDIIYVVTAQYNDKPGLLLLTCDRILFVHKVLFKSELLDIKLDYITTTDATTNMVYGQITIAQGANKLNFSKIYRNHIYALHEKITNLKGRRNTKSGSYGKSQKALDNNNISRLLENGVISKEEHQRLRYLISII